MCKKRQKQSIFFWKIRTSDIEWESYIYGEESTNMLEWVSKILSEVRRANRVISQQPRIIRGRPWRHLWRRRLGPIPPWVWRPRLCSSWVSPATRQSPDESSSSPPEPRLKFFPSFPQSRCHEPKERRRRWTKGEKWTKVDASFETGLERSSERMKRLMEKRCETTFNSGVGNKSGHGNNPQSRHPII